MDTFRNEARVGSFFYRYSCSKPWRSKKEDARHAHNLCELIYFQRGDATHIIEGRRYRLSRGDLVLVRPRRYHDIRFDSEREYERYNILFDIEGMGLWRAADVTERFEVISLADRPMTAAIFPKMEAYREALPPEEFAEAAGHLLFTLFYDLSLLPAEEGRRHTAAHPVLTDALAYIRDNLFTVRDVGEIAAALHVTESYLFRIFRTELSTGPARYVTEKRLLAAQSMIRLGRRPSEVFSECGFQDYTAFFRAYKKFFGTAPSQG